VRPILGPPDIFSPDMIYAVAAIWLLIGLGVFFIAIRGGPRGARESLYTESSTGGRLVTFGIVLLFAFGLVVPALVLGFNSANKAGVAVGGLRLNAEQQRGRVLFARSCAFCHTLAATKSVGRIGPNLDVRVGADISTPAGRKALVSEAIANGRARGLGQMPAMLYQGREAEEVASFVAAVAGH
jgi:mono/diheme cytochrome c family protein